MPVGGVCGLWWKKSCQKFKQQNKPVLKSKVHHVHYKSGLHFLTMVHDLGFFLYVKLHLHYFTLSRLPHASTMLNIAAAALKSNCACKFRSCHDLLELSFLFYLNGAYTLKHMHRHLQFSSASLLCTWDIVNVNCETCTLWKSTTCVPTVKEVLLTPRLCTNCRQWCRGGW